MALEGSFNTALVALRSGPLPPPPRALGTKPMCGRAHTTGSQEAGRDERTDGICYLVTARGFFYEQRANLPDAVRCLDGVG